MYPQNQYTQKYREQQVLNASPAERLVIIYDVALLACTRRDLEKFSRAMGVLLEGLDFNYPEVANGLLAIYQWCGELARKKRYDEAAGILRELRDTWQSVIQRSNAVQPTEAGVAAMVA